MGNQESEPLRLVPTFAKKSPWMKSTQLLSIVEMADLIEMHRGAYKHWAIYVGNGKVIHVRRTDGQEIAARQSAMNLLSLNNKEQTDNREQPGSEATDLHRSPSDIRLRHRLSSVVPVFVFEEDLIEVVKDSECRVNNHLDITHDPLNAGEAIARANEMVDKEWNYCLLRKNCEHFVTWCRNGQSRSKQVRTGVGVMGTTSVVIVVGVAAAFAMVILRSKSPAPAA